MLSLYYWSQCEKNRSLRTVSTLCPQAEAEAAWPANGSGSQKQACLVCSPSYVFITQKWAWIRAVAEGKQGIQQSGTNHWRLLEFIQHRNFREGSSPFLLWATSFGPRISPLSVILCECFLCDGGCWLATHWKSTSHLTFVSATGCIGVCSERVSYSPSVKWRLMC